MAATDPTVNYGWNIPDVGGDIGSWGGILNTVFGEELSAADLLVHAVTPLTPPPGIDQIVGLIQTALDLAEEDLLILQDSVTVLESEVTPAFYAKITPTIGQTLQNNSWTQLVLPTPLFNEGDVISGSTLVPPAGSEGAWLVRAHITADPWNDSDNFRRWELQIRRNGTAIADAITPHQNDGGSSSSGDISLTATALELVTTAEILAGVVFTVWARHWQPNSENPAAASFSSTASKMFFEAARVAPKDVGEV